MADIDKATQGEWTLSPGGCGLVNRNGQIADFLRYLPLDECAANAELARRAVKLFRYLTSLILIVNGKDQTAEEQPKRPDSGKQKFYRCLPLNQPIRLVEDERATNAPRDRRDCIELRAGESLGDTFYKISRVMRELAAGRAFRTDNSPKDRRKAKAKEASSSYYQPPFL